MLEGVTLTLKPYVSGLPSVAVILIGQFKLRGEIKRLIEADKNQKAESAKVESGKPAAP